MIAPIIVPAPASIPWIVQVHAAAAEKYSTLTEQKAFIDGAKWEHGADCSGWKLMAGIVVVMWLPLNLVAFCFGAADTSTPYSFGPVLGGKWDYLFPGYCVGYKFGKFMGKAE
jgi:hypothetical protein